MSIYRKKDTRQRRPLTGTIITVIVWLLLFWELNAWLSLSVALTVTTVLIIIPVSAYQLWLWTPETMRRTNRHRIDVHRHEQNRLTLAEAKRSDLRLNESGLPLASLEQNRDKRGSTLIGIPTKRREAHALFVAPTRGGKSLHVIQTLLTSDDCAMVVIDPKGEAWERTAGYRAEYVGSVYRFPGSTVDLADYYDLTARDDIEELIKHLLKPDNDKQPIFAEKCKYLFAAAAAYATHHNLNPIRTLFDLAESPPSVGLSALETVAPAAVRNFTNGSKPTQLDRFAQSAWGTFSTRMFPYQHHLHTLTTNNGLSAVPLNWAEQKATIYITYPFDVLQGVGPALSGLVAALLRYQVAQRRSDPIIFAIDELPAVGLTNINHYLATVGGYRITVALYIQAYSQLVTLYGLNGAESIVANCQNQVWYPPADERTAQRMSKLYGTHLQPSQSFSTGSRDKRLVPDLGTQERGRSTHLQIHPALSPEAMLALDADEVIVRYERGHVLKAYRVWPIPRYDTLPPPAYDVVAVPAKRRPPHWMRQ